MRQILGRLLSTSKDCFAAGGERSNFIQHGFNLVPGYHPSATPASILSAQIVGKRNELLNYDVMEECKSPYAELVVMVPMKDSSTSLPNLTIEDKNRCPTTRSLDHEKLVIGSQKCVKVAKINLHLFIHLVKSDLRKFRLDKKILRAPSNV